MIKDMVDMLKEIDKLNKVIEEIKLKCEYVTTDVSPDVVDATYIANEILDLIVLKVD